MGEKMRIIQARIKLSDDELGNWLLRQQNIQMYAMHATSATASAASCRLVASELTAVTYPSAATPATILTHAETSQH